MDIQDCEKTGPLFNLETYLAARRSCIEAVDEIIKSVKPGMTEKEGQVLTKEIFKTKTANKFWHPTKFRMGPDTTKSFSELGNPEIICEAGEICFIDVGPIIDGHEADLGRSFTIRESSKYSALAESSEIIFKKTAAHWKVHQVTGEKLYEFASNEAEKLGYFLNTQMAGHRLGDFPHKVYSSEKLLNFKKVPIENLWVLEIHLIDEKSGRGSFFEDILF
jgi:methionine aminopeptidase